MYPEEGLASLERALSGETLTEAETLVRSFFESVEAIGISADDVIELIREESCHS